MSFTTKGLKWLASVAIVTVAEVLVAVAFHALVPSPAAAQFFEPFPSLQDRRRPQRYAPQQQFNPFGGIFGQPVWQPPPYRPRRDRPPGPSSSSYGGDFSKAPVARKPAAPPAATVLVMGDAMADWLGHGLDEAFADNPEFGVARKIRTYSGLIRNESRTESYDWVQSARESLATEKVDLVVMMIGLSDRQSIRERPRRQPQPGQPGQPGQSGQPGQPAQSAQPGTPQSGEGQAKPDQPAAAPEALASPITHEFRSEKWAELYAKRVDETIAAMKSKGTPVVWVGLPPIRGTRSKSEITYLNDIYKSRAEKSGITYVDVWDGFADEDGNFTLRGPDYNGQMRQLRTSDGVYFTKAGAAKLAHYVEREIQRLLVARATPVALPAPEPQPQAPAPTKPGAPTPRPMAGPVVPLTASTAAAEDLVGGGPPRSTAADPVATRVLVRGEVPTAAPGRADDFAWPRADVDADTSIIPVVVTPTTPAPAARRPGTKGPTPAHRPAPKRPGQAAATTPPPAAPRQVR